MERRVHRNTMDPVQHILAIAERERRKRALSPSPGQLPGMAEQAAEQAPRRRRDEP